VYRNVAVLLGRGVLHRVLGSRRRGSRPRWGSSRSSCTRSSRG
jgi:hypothetical protein